MNVTPQTEIRHLRTAVRFYLAEKFLDHNDNWKKLASVIKKSPTDVETLYSNEEISVFSLIRKGESPTLKLLDDWGSRGRVRPTIQTLIDLLVDSDQYGAACYLAVDVLRGPPPERPDFGPSAEVLITSLQKMGTTTDFGEAHRPNSPSLLVASERHEFKQNEYIRQQDQYKKPQDLGKNHIPGILTPEIEKNLKMMDAPHNIAVPHVSYEELFRCTKGFSRDVELGRGGFGGVYLGQLKINRIVTKVAVKKLTIGEDKQFVTEIRAMTRYVHENLLAILGFSCDNPCGRCLVYAYMANGSLQDRLAQKHKTPPLPWEVRINIAIGTAQGLIALHTMHDKPLVHCDIKSANILLDENFVAKIGDFGIARLGMSWEDSTKAMTSKWYGTPVYMAEEAMRGSITVKLDTYSFGVVLLELLTGLPPYDNTRSEPALSSYIDEEEKPGNEWCDPKAGNWPPDVANSLFDLAIKCNESKKRKRPLVQDVLKELEAIKIS